MRGRRARNQDELLEKSHRKKKSWRFVAELHQCEICGKSFESARAVFGHLRHHSGKRTKRSSAGEEEWQDSEVSVGDTLVVPKRARTLMPQNPILNRPSDDGNEVEEAAMTLMMMRFGLRDCDVVECDEMKKERGGFWRHKCRICKRGFDSHQALGGHQTFHRMQSKVMKPEEMMMTKAKEKCNKCSVCFKVFGSRRALGGHIKCHRSFLGRQKGEILI